MMYSMIHSTILLVGSLNHQENDEYPEIVRKEQSLSAADSFLGCVIHYVVPRFQVSRP